VEKLIEGDHMNNLIKIAVTLAFLATASDNLPKILYYVRLAQTKLIIDSQASKWTRPMLLNNK
jgi:hypothetical protein